VLGMHPRVSVAALSLFLFVTVSRAESAELSRPEDAAAFVIPSCRQSTEPGSISEAFEQGMCIGLLKGLYYLSSDACIPPAITIGAVARIVVKYIDHRPTRMHEDLRELALEALKTAWPCSGVRIISSVNDPSGAGNAAKLPTAPGTNTLGTANSSGASSSAATAGNSGSTGSPCSGGNAQVGARGNLHQRALLATQRGPRQTLTQS
jgi:hypothetical protein